LFELKRRPPDKQVQLLAPDASWLERVGVVDDRARRLAAAFWPGPLTLVVRAASGAPGALAAAGTVGVRVPRHDLALDVLRRTGALAASSANRSGEATPATAAEIEALFGDAVAVYLDAGRIVGTGSTVVDLCGDAPRILRGGPISEADVKEVARGSI
jgi:L-threonylcarbamoyladenylate synthase